MSSHIELQVTFLTIDVSIVLLLSLLTTDDVTLGNTLLIDLFFFFDELQSAES